MEKNDKYKFVNVDVKSIKSAQGYMQRGKSLSPYTTAYNALLARFTNKAFSEKQAERVFEEIPGLGFCPDTTIRRILGNLERWLFIESII